MDWTELQHWKLLTRNFTAFYKAALVAGCTFCLCPDSTLSEHILERPRLLETYIQMHVLRPSKLFVDRYVVALEPQETDSGTVEVEHNAKAKLLSVANKGCQRCPIPTNGRPTTFRVLDSDVVHATGLAAKRTSCTVLLLDGSFLSPPEALPSAGVSRASASRERDPHSLSVGSDTVAAASDAALAIATAYRRLDRGALRSHTDKIRTEALEAVGSTSLVVGRESAIFDRLNRLVSESIMRLQCGVESAEASASETTTASAPPVGPIVSHPLFTSSMFSAALDAVSHVLMPHFRYVAAQRVAPLLSRLAAGSAAAKVGTYLLQSLAAEEVGSDALDDPDDPDAAGQSPSDAIRVGSPVSSASVGADEIHHEDADIFLALAFHAAAVPLASGTVAPYVPAYSLDPTSGDTLTAPNLSFAAPPEPSFEPLRLQAILRLQSKRSPSAASVLTVLQPSDVHVLTIMQRIELIALAQDALSESVAREEVCADAVLPTLCKAIARTCARFPRALIPDEAVDYNPYGSMSSVGSPSMNGTSGLWSKPSSTGNLGNLGTFPSSTMRRTPSQASIVGDLGAATFVEATALARFLTASDGKLVDYSDDGSLSYAITTYRIAMEHLVGLLPKQETHGTATTTSRRSTMDLSLPASGQGSRTHADRRRSTRRSMMIPAASSRASLLSAAAGNRSLERQEISPDRRSVSAYPVIPLTDENDEPLRIRLDPPAAQASSGKKGIGAFFKGLF